MIQIRRSALVRRPPDVMFDLVNDVEAYPSAFPWCAGSAVLERDESELTARLDLRLAGMTQSFTTRNTVSRPERIHMHWSMARSARWRANGPSSPSASPAARSRFALDFEYSGRFTAPALRLGFQNLADRMVDDFCRRRARSTNG